MLSDCDLGTLVRKYPAAVLQDVQQQPVAVEPVERSETRDGITSTSPSYLQDLHSQDIGASKTNGIAETALGGSFGAQALLYPASIMKAGLPLDHANIAEEVASRRLVLSAGTQTELTSDDLIAKHLQQVPKAHPQPSPGSLQAHRGDDPNASTWTRRQVHWTDSERASLPIDERRLAIQSEPDVEINGTSSLAQLQSCRTLPSAPAPSIEVLSAQESRHYQSLSTYGFIARHSVPSFFKKRKRESSLPRDTSSVP